MTRCIRLLVYSSSCPLSSDCLSSSLFYFCGVTSLVPDLPKVCNSAFCFLWCALVCGLLVWPSWCWSYLTGLVPCLPWSVRPLSCCVSSLFCVVGVVNCCLTFAHIRLLISLSYFGLAGLLAFYLVHVLYVVLSFVSVFLVIVRLWCSLGWFSSLIIRIFMSSFIFIYFYARC